MALHITHLCDRKLSGTLDGQISVRLDSDETGTSARIGTWLHKIRDRRPATLGEMRSTAYEALARYRESQRGIGA